MQVILIGSGNIARLMGHILQANGHTIRQVFSRNQLHAEKLADALNAQPLSQYEKLAKDADCYIVAVSDSAIAEVATWLRVNDQLVIHTAGSVSKNVLQGTSTNYGVLWPIRMIRDTITHLAGATLVFDGNTDIALHKIKTLAEIFSSNVLQAGDEQRARMHMIATFTVNFSNHLFHLAADYCLREKIPFEAFYPLIQSAVAQLETGHPRNLQAGPAFRGDMPTIAQHESLLNNDPPMLALYELFTASIIHMRNGEGK